MGKTGNTQPALMSFLENSQVVLVGKSTVGLMNLWSQLTPPVLQPYIKELGLKGGAVGFQVFGLVYYTPKSSAFQRISPLNPSACNVALCDQSQREEMHKR